MSFNCVHVILGVTVIELLAHIGLIPHSTDRRPPSQLHDMLRKPDHVPLKRSLFLTLLLARTIPTDQYRRQKKVGAILTAPTHSCHCKTSYGSAPYTPPQHQTS